MKVLAVHGGAMGACGRDWHVSCTATGNHENVTGRFSSANREMCDLPLRHDSATRPSCAVE
jgi:hypothetical protein